jgi:hypothetical protein
MKSTIIGVWNLEAFTILPKEGGSRPWGEGLRGLLIYTESGHVSVSINRNLLPKSGNAEKDVLDSVLFYAGTYSVEGNVIRHQVNQATNPDRIGREMIRFAALENTTLKLATPDEAFGKAELVWRKIA